MPMPASPDQMTPQERRASVALAGLYSLRMLGFFMVFPVLALHAATLRGADSTYVGIAIGAYGLTQALFQMPYGLLSDRFGRKPMIVAGLLVFALGSAVAALGTDIWTVIVGRALQGAGAISAAVMALAADLTREEHRTKAMAMIGASIGMAFLVAMVAGPFLTGYVGVPGLFWLTALLALLGIGVLLLLVPDPIESHLHRDAEAEPAQLRDVLRNGELLRLDVGIFSLHLVQTANFVVIPAILVRDGLGAAPEHWKLYLPVMVLAMAVMVPFIVIGERKRRMKQVLLGAVLLLAVAEAGLALGNPSLYAMFGLLFVFFCGFNILEATLPSWVSKVVPGEAKGTAMGVYSTSQFAGAFVGGATGGILHQYVGDAAVFLVSAAVLVTWFLVAMGMPGPRYLATHLLRVGRVALEEARRLELALVQVRGVAEARVNPDDGVAYLKVDNHALDRAALEAFSRAD